LSRVAVEHHAKGDALDMTWVRFIGTLRAAKKFLKVQRNDPATHADNIENQKEQKYTGLIAAWMAPHSQPATQSASRNTAPAFTGPRFQQSPKSAEESKTPCTSV
jgi:hypothetical protein